MKTRNYIISLVLGACTFMGVSAHEVKNSSSILPKDQELDNLEYYLIDSKSFVDKWLNMPEVKAPIGFSPNMINDMPLPSPTDKITLIKPPYANNQGSARLEYDFEFSPAKNGTAPSFKLFYDSRNQYGLAGYGWDINLPKLVLDSTCIDASDKEWKSNYGACYIDGVRYVSVNYNEEDKTFPQAGVDTFFAETNPYDTYLLRHVVTPTKKKNEKGEKSDYIFWELIKKDGSHTFFGNLKNPFRYDPEEEQKKKDPQYNKENEDKFDNQSRLLKKNDSQKDTIVVEWGVAYTADFYGNYVEYNYHLEDIVPYLDSIRVGNAHMVPHTSIRFSYEKMNDTTIKNNSYGFEVSRKHLVKSIEMYYYNDDEKNSKPKYEQTRAYNFSYAYIAKKYSKIRSLSEIEQSCELERSTVSHKHKFTYCNDFDAIKRRKLYYRNTEDESIFPYFLNRSYLLNGVENPIGGCFTILYGASNYRLPQEQVPVQEIEEQEPEEIDGIVYAPLKKYIEPVDSFGHILCMTGLRVSNGIENFVHQKFSYKSQRWNDDTTIFSGFDTVSVYNLDLDTEKPLSTWEKAYDRSEELTKDMVSSAKFYDGNKERLLEEIAVVNKAVTPSRFSSDNKYYLLFAYQIVTSYKDNSSVPSYMTRTFNINEETGYVEDIDDRTGNSSPLQNLRHIFTYTDKYKKSDNIWGLPTSLSVRDGKDEFYAFTLDYNNAKNPSRVTALNQKVNENKNVTTKFSYDADGNMTQCLYPANVNNQQMKVNYLYDRKYNMYLNRVDNSLGYRTELDDYDYHYGKPCTIVDRNGTTMKRKFDNMGRITTIIAPNEVEVGDPYTLKYQYEKFLSLDNKNYDILNRPFRDTLFLDVPDSVFYGLYDEDLLTTTLNIFFKNPNKKDLDLSIACKEDWDTIQNGLAVKLDSADANRCLCHFLSDKLTYSVKIDNENGEFVLLSDGLGYITQTKEKHDVTTFNEDYSLNDNKDLYWVLNTDPAPQYGVSFVSNQISQEVSDKTRGQYYKVSNADPYYSKNSYDVFGRLSQVDKYANSSDLSSTVLQVTLHDTYRNIYSEYETKRGLVKVTTDPFNTFKEVAFYSDPLSDDADSLTSYELTPMGQVLSKRTGSNVIKYTYDMRGLMLTEQSNSSDINKQYTYDDAGNLLSVTNNGKEIIKYSYDWDQLTAIEYPNEPYNNVKYSYGDKNANFNRVGQIAYVEDGVGVQELYYGRMGEVIKTRRSIVAPNELVRTYEMSWKYSSLNRLNELIYPDNEILTYTYDVAGLPTSVSGSKSYTYNYVNKAGYDFMGRRVYLQYCNGDKFYTTYNPVSGNIATQLILSLVIQDPEVADPSKVVKEYAECMASTTIEEYNPTYSHITDFYSLYGANISHGRDAIFTGRLLSSVGYYETIYGSSKAGYDVTYSYDRYNPSESHINYYQDNFDVTEFLSNSETYTYNADGDRVVPHIDVYKNAENRIGAKSSFGYYNTYWYDYQGSSVIGTGSGFSQMLVNGTSMGGNVDKPVLSYQLNRYFSMKNTGDYTKYIYLGDEEVVKKEGDNDSYGKNPAREERAGSDFGGKKTSYKTLYDQAYDNLVARYKLANYPLNLEKVNFIDNKGDYRNGVESDENGETKSASLRNSNINLEKDNFEEKQYYIHRYNDGSIFYFSDLNAWVTDIIFATPFGTRLFNKLPKE